MGIGYGRLVRERQVIYRVTYQSMTAFYGPSFIEAEDEADAKRKFNARGAFSAMELAVCVNARPASVREAMDHAGEQQRANRI